MTPDEGGATATVAPGRCDTALTAFAEGDAPVFVISLEAGGFGLNLTAAA